MRQVIIFILFTILLAACSVTGKRRAAPVSEDALVRAEDFYNELRQDNLSSSGFYISRADIDLNTPAIDIKLIATVKYLFPDSLFISLRTRTGIEAGRVLLTDDTVLVNDRINRLIYYGEPGDLEKKYQIPASAVFAMFGDFIGQPQTYEKSVRCVDGTHLCVTRIGGYTLKYEIDCYNGKPFKAFISGITQANGIQADFGEFIRSGNKRIPGSIKVMTGDNKVNFTMGIRNIQTGWTGEIDFIPGRNYRKVRIR